MPASRQAPIKLKKKSSGELRPASGQVANRASKVALPVSSEANCETVLHQVIRRFHSEVGSPLAAIGLRLEMLRRSPVCDEATKKTLDELGSELESVVDSVRASLKSLRKLEKEVVSGTH